MIRGYLREGEIRRWAPWIGAGLVLLAFVILEIRINDVCWNERAVKALKINEAAGCFDYWLNRYQTLVGVGVASLAVIFAWIGVKRQVVAANNQILIAHRQATIGQAGFIQERISSLINLFGEIEATADAVRILTSDIHIATTILVARLKTFGLEKKHDVPSKEIQETKEIFEAIIIKCKDNVSRSESVLQVIREVAIDSKLRTEAMLEINHILMRVDAIAGAAEFSVGFIDDFAKNNNSEDENMQFLETIVNEFKNIVDLKIEVDFMPEIQRMQRILDNIIGINASMWEDGAT